MVPQSGAETAAKRGRGTRELRLPLMFQRHALPAGGIWVNSRGGEGSHGSEWHLRLNENGAALLHQQRAVEEEVVHRERDAARESKLFGRQTRRDVHPSQNRPQRDSIELVAIGRRQHMAHDTPRAAGRR